MNNKRKMKKKKKPAPEETHYSCEPISDLKLLFKKTPSGK
jgi:hypothetical protein